MTQLLERPETSGNGHAMTRRNTVMGSLAERYEMDPAKLLDTLKATCIKGNATNEQVQAFCIVANRYGLDPFLKEIHAFAAQGGGIVPIVGIDGWSKIANATKLMDGCEFTFDGTGNDLSCTCTIYVKGREHPVRVTEYLSECNRSTPPWKQYPRRMLRHRAFIQCARLSFGFGGIYDEDEAKEIVANSEPIVVTDSPSRPRGAAALVDRIQSKVAPAKQLESPIIEPQEEPDVTGADAEPDPEIESSRQAQLAALAEADQGHTEQRQEQAAAAVSDDDVKDYQHFFGLCEEAAGYLSPDEFTKAMGALRVSAKYPVLSGGRKGIEPRKAVVQAFREQRVKADGTIDAGA